MTTDHIPNQDADALVEVALLARRAGLRLTAGELAALVEPYRRIQHGMQALRADLPAHEEPAVTFAAGTQEKGAPHVE